MLSIVSDGHRVAMSATCKEYFLWNELTVISVQLPDVKIFCIFFSKVFNLSAARDLY